ALLRRACPEHVEVLKVVAGLPDARRGVAIFEGCGFDRYEVITLAEVEAKAGSESYRAPLMTFTAHQWLLDQGFDVPTLRPITRALYSLERRRDWRVRPVPNAQWPVAVGYPLATGTTVQVTRDGLVFNEERVVELAHGVVDRKAVRAHLIDPLFDQLAQEVDKAKQIAEIRAQAWDRRLIVAADADTPYL